MSPSIVSSCKSVNLVERPASVSSFATYVIPSGINRNANSYRTSRSYRTSVSGPSLALSEVAADEVQAGSPERNNSRVDLHKSSIIPSSPSPQPPSTMGAEGEAYDRMLRV